MKTQNTNQKEAQIEKNFQQLRESVQESTSKIFESIENYTHDIEDVKDLFYNNNVEEIAEILNLTIILEAYRYGLREI